MKIERPRFELTRVSSDGTRERPEVIPVGQMPWNTEMARRGFLGLGIASVLLLIDGEATAEVTPTTTSQTNNVPAKVPDNALKAHKDSVRALAFSPDRRILTSYSGDQTIKLWAMPNGKLRTTLQGHKRPVNALAISPDGKILASGSWDNTIKLWSMADGKLFATLEEHKDSINELAISPNGKILASGSADKTIKLWSLPSGKLLTTLEGHRRFVNISPDGKTLVSFSWDKTIKLWSLPDGKPLNTLEGHQNSVEALAISPDGKILAAASDYQTIKLWSMPDGKLLTAIDGNKTIVNALVISPDGKILASASNSQTIKLWSLPDGKLLASLERNNSSIQSLSISPDGTTLASPSLVNDKTIKLWTLADGKLLATLEGHKGYVHTLAISSDGKTLASGDSDGVIILWDLEKRTFISFLFDPKENRTDAISYNIYDRITGRTITFTLPCGSPIPPGAVCTCNCVSGTDKPPTPRRGGSPSGGGTYCTCNKICTCIPVSDRDVKEAFQIADPLLILQRLSELSIQTWNYNWDDASIRHIGPMAQDFAAAFAVGEDDKHIHPVDAQGVAFAAIQALYQIVKEKDAQTERLRTELLSQQEENKALNDRVEALERFAMKAQDGGSEGAYGEQSG
jgi:WD40 repeat protein